MKKIFPLLFLFVGCSIAAAQDIVKNTEQFPIFRDCRGLMYQELEKCFNNQLQEFVYRHFQVPAELKDANYKGSMIVLFEVDDHGVFKTLYIDTNDERLTQEVKNRLQ